uniref:Putative secreted protein n=1 Tax=Corethrella appendiculata TaxID=1370023 RepID=U5ESF9_9DIPT
MRTKHFLLGLCIVIGTSLFLILGPAGQQNDSLKNIVTQTHQHLKDFQKNLRDANEKKLEIDQKYLTQLGFIPTHSSLSASASASTSSQTIYSINNQTIKTNFSVVTYTFNGEIASTILHAQNIATKLPNELLIIYDLGLNEQELQKLQAFCNNSKCIVITYDLQQLPSYIFDQQMHAFRPILIHDALMRSRTILFMENNIRIRGNSISKEINELKLKTENNGVGIFGWTTRQATSSRTHPKMFDYFETFADSFLFLPMVSLDFIFFTNTNLVNNKIMLPWIKCMLTPECIHPIGAQSGGCKFNKKPLYRYSGCHGYDVSAFNIVLGLTFGFDETKYSTHDESSSLYYVETLEQATKILENRRKNISDTSEHPFDE